MQSGSILSTHWKLYYCDQFTGCDHLSQWGSEDELKVAMSRADKRGEDVWLISPDGEKVLPDNMTA